MALTKDRVTFALNTSTGNQVVPTSIDPKIVLFIGTRSGASQTIYQSDPPAGMGVYFGMTDGVSQYCGVMAADNPSGSTRASAALFDNAVIKAYMDDAGVSNVVFAASIVSLGTGQFTINVDTAPASAVQVTALCLGGSDIVSTAGSNGALTGGLGATISDTALGTTPSGVLFIGTHRETTINATGSDGPGLMLGAAAAGVSQRGVGATPDGGDGDSYVAREDAVLPGVGFGGDAYDDGWAVQSPFDASGFTLEKVQDDAHDGHYAALAVEGAQFALDTIVSPTSATTVSTTGLSFAPEAVVMESADLDVVPDVQGGAKIMAGVSDGIGESVAAHTNSPTDGGGVESYSEAKVIRSVAIEAATVLEEADVTFTADGADYAFTTADATTREHFALYVGPSSSSGNPPNQPTAQTPLWIAGTHARLHSSAYSEPDGDAHQSSDWQVDVSGGDFSSPVYEALDSADLEEHTIPQDTLSRETDYIYRVRHTDTDGDSTYSAAQAFTTTGKAAEGGFGTGGL